MADVNASIAHVESYTEPDQPLSSPSPAPPPDTSPARHIPAGYVVCDECDELVPKPKLATHQSTLCAQSLADCLLSNNHYDICHLHTPTASTTTDDGSEGEEGEEAEHTREEIASHIERSIGVHVLFLMDTINTLTTQVTNLQYELNIERKRRTDMEDQIKQVITTLAEKVDHAQVARFSAPSVSHVQPRTVVRTTSGRVVQKRGGERDRDGGFDSYPVRSSLNYESTFSSASSSGAPMPFDPVLDKPLAPSTSAWKSAVKSKAPDTSSSAFLAARSAASAASASSSHSSVADIPTDPAQLTKRIHSTLNKLTPTNYDKLSTSLVTLFQSITTPSLLATLTAQLFDKALEDIFFGTMYARLCRLLAVGVSGVGGDTKVSFRYYLLNKCQDEFVKFVEKEETRKRDERKEEEKGKKQEENKADKDGSQEEKKEVEEGESESSGELSGEERDAARAAPKRRFIAAIRFIGELFLQDLVTLPIMIACISQLLSNVRDESGEASEDSIQGLCKLLTTVGGRIEQQEQARERMRSVWDSMRAEAEAEGKHSSRGRFALLDVLDARAKGWKQREAQKGQSATGDKITAPPAAQQQPVMRLGFDEPARSGGGGGGAGGGGNERDRVREREQRERERELIPQNTSDARLAQASAMATTVKRWTPGVRKVTASTDHPI